MTFRRARDTTPVAWDQDITQKLNLTATTFSEIRPFVTIAFRAPTSGKVIVTVGGGVRDSASTNRVYLAPRVSEAFGEEADVLTPTDPDNVYCAGPQTTNYYFGQRSILLTGLTAGREYAARLEFAVEAAATCDITARDLLIEPVT